MPDPIEAISFTSDVQWHDHVHIEDDWFRPTLDARTDDRKPYISQTSFLGQMLISIKTGFRTIEGYAVFIEVVPCDDEVSTCAEEDSSRFWKCCLAPGHEGPHYAQTKESIHHIGRMISTTFQMRRQLVREDA